MCQPMKEEIVLRALHQENRQKRKSAIVRTPYSMCNNHVFKLRLWDDV
jgi:hypothetical protein